MAQALHSAPRASTPEWRGVCVPPFPHPFPTQFVSPSTRSAVDSSIQLEWRCSGLAEDGAARSRRRKLRLRTGFSKPPRGSVQLSCHVARPSCSGCPWASCAIDRFSHCSRQLRLRSLTRDQGFPRRSLNMKPTVKQTPSAKKKQSVKERVARSTLVLKIKSHIRAGRVTC